jgi:hypothetical protein
MAVLTVQKNQSKKHRFSKSAYKTKNAPETYPHRLPGRLDVNFLLKYKAVSLCRLGISIGEAKTLVNRKTMILSYHPPVQFLTFNLAKGWIPLNGKEGVL